MLSTPLYMKDDLEGGTHTTGQTYGIFLWVAHFHPENVVQQPVDRLLLVKHKYELHYEIQIRSLEHLT